MKTFYTLVLVTLFALGLNAQCEVPNGGFEEWTDFSPELNATYGTSIPAESVLYPTDWVPFSSILSIVFGELNIPQIVSETDVADLGTAILGSERSDDAKRGDYALKIGGSTTQDDVVYTSISACVPVNADRFSYRFKHVGELGVDSLLLLVYMGESSTDMLNANSQYDDVVGKYIFDYITSDEDLSYVSRRIDMVTNNANLSIDSMVIQIGVYRENAEKGSYFILDDVNFLGATSAQEKASAIPFSISQNVSGDRIFPQLDLNSYAFNKAEILDINGRVMQSFTEWKDVVEVSDLHAGSYFFVIHCDEGVKAETFIKL